MQSGQEGGAHLGLGLFQESAAGQDHVVAVLVQLNDLGFQLTADVRLQVAHAAHFHQGGRQESAQTDINNQAALDNLDNGAVDDPVFLLHLFDVAPGAFVLSALLGQQQTAFFVFLLEDQSFDFVTNFDFRVRIHVMFNGQFAGKNNAFGFVTDIEQNFVAINFHDSTGDKIAIIEVLDGLVDFFDEVLGRADVVNGNLRNSSRDISSIGHLVGDSKVR